MGHVPLYLSESANKFLKFRNHHVRVVVTGKEVNRSIGLGLEIPLDYYFQGDNWAIEWFKKSIKKLDKCMNVKVKKCMKELAEPAYLLNFFKITYL